MGWKNNTIVTEFILLGLSTIPEIERFLFFTFLFIYLATLIGNSLLIAITLYEPRFHSPMYLFIGQLSFLDICYSSVTIPKMLVNLLAEKKTISLPGCLIQLHFFVQFACSENQILTVMAYDRYVAICSPLHYSRRMSRRTCILLLCISWFFSCLYSLVQSLSTYHLSFCGSGIINHFFCDLPALLRVSCSDATSTIVSVLLLGGLLGVSSIAIMIGSYALITATILKIPSTRGRQKAFSTCSAHLFVVALFYGTFFFAYFQSLSHTELEKGALASVFYTTVTPMFNPFIYALRNTEIKVGLAKQWLRLCYCRTMVSIKR